MTTKTIRLLNPMWKSKLGDKDELLINFEVIENEKLGRADEANYTFVGKIVIGISGTLRSTWHLDEMDLEKALVEFAKQQLRDKLIDGSLGKDEELQLSSYNAPQQCPFNVSGKDYYQKSSFEVDLPDIVSNEKNNKTIAAKIIDLRDNINAIFGEKFKGRLLALPQERSLSELTRNCESEEEFAFRVSSLCALATAIETSRLIIPLDDDQSKGSIDKFGKFLRHKFPTQNTTDITNILTKFNHFRRMYPIHTDRASGVIEAYCYFGIEYPPKEYQSSWLLLLRHYLHWLEKLLELLRNM